MPTYQYRCKECHHELEVVQSFSDDPLETCPECQGRLRKIYGNVGISFKGSGFYKTDSRSSGKPKGESSSTTEPSDKKDSDSTKKADAAAPSGDGKAGSSSSSPSSGSTTTT